MSILDSDRWPAGLGVGCAPAVGLAGDGPSRAELGQAIPHARERLAREGCHGDGAVHRWPHGVRMAGILMNSKSVRCDGPVRAIAHRVVAAADGG